jgi:2-dehydro-3-deoxyphosphogalactonate aldolase
MTLTDVINTMPLIAVLRHIKPEEANGIGQALVDSGFTCLEVPMNSPNPCDSIAKLAEAFGDQALVGAGTVIQVEDVQKIKDAGGEIIIMPHSDVRVIEESKRLGLCCVPGISTPTEAYAAIHAGADALKLFPAIGNPPSVVKAIRAILPKDMPLIPTGGVVPDMMEDYLKAGANGFGLGGALYKPGDTPEIVTEKAKAFVDEIKRIQKG